MTEHNPFAHLDFDSFRDMASDPSLSMYEKIGFPDSYRQGYEKAISETDKIDVDLKAIFNKMISQSRDNVSQLIAQVTKLGGEPAETHRGLGLIYRQYEQLPEAKVRFERYLELAPTAPDAMLIRSYVEGPAT